MNNKIIIKLRENYGYQKTFLRYSKPYELLIAVILSAQCTDEVVNKVTLNLFSKYPSLNDLANANKKDVENIVFKTGFYKNKAKNIIECSKQVIKKFDLKIPKNISEMITLPGVGRKTANVVLNELYNLNQGIAVDTHVSRLSFRLGLTNSKNPEIIEKDLMKLFEKNDWRDISIYFIVHGRKICTARKAYCDYCFLNKECLNFKKIKEYTNKSPVNLKNKKT